MSNWYVRKGGSDNNGGSSSGTSPDRSGSDLSATNGSTQVTSASASFAAGDVGKGINISGVIYRIATFTNSTTVQLERTYGGTTGGSKTWAIGGAVATINKILNTAAAIMQAGDTMWVGAGVYRETLTCSLTSPASEIVIAGDTDGSKTGDVGMVQITAYATNDKTAPGSTTLLNLNGKAFLTFKNFLFIIGNAIAVTATTSVSNDIKFTDCAFLAGHTSGGGGVFTVTVPFGTAINWTIDRCYFLVSRQNNGVIGVITLTTSASGSDYDANFVVKNSTFIGQNAFAFSVVNSGTNAKRGGGVKIRNCSFFGLSALLTSTSISTTVPCTVNNCLVYSGNSNCVNANTSGQITEDYNIFNSSTPRTNVTAGTHSISDGSYAVLLHFGQERIWGAKQRYTFEPMDSSPLLGFGSDGSHPTTDQVNAARPSGGASANAGIGALERSNTWAKETGTVRTGTNALSITGPGYQDFLIPVDASSTTVAVYMRYDSTYAGTKPQIQVLNGTECGVADATSSAVTTVNTWEQLSLTFTPTSKGIVTIRLLSSDTNGGGKAFADDFSIS